MKDKGKVDRGDSYYTRIILLYALEGGHRRKEMSQGFKSTQLSGELKYHEKQTRYKLILGL